MVTVPYRSFLSLCACASSTWFLLLVGVVDVACPAQFNISANVQRWMTGDGDHDYDDGAIRAHSKLASTVFLRSDAALE